MAEVQVYDPPETETVFVWSGGPYISVYWADAWRLRVPAGSGEDSSAVPFTAIRVYEDGTGKTTIRSREEMIAKCREWIGDNAGDMGGWLEHSV